MKKEVKICLPIYKILYSVMFMLILSLVRGIVYVSEIGIAIETPMALLATVFCADTYLVEVQSHRREVFRLYRLRKQTAVVMRRLVIQIVYLVVISMVGYGFFYWQKPVCEIDGLSSFGAFGMFFIAIVGTVLFWGMLSATLCNLVRNVWIGIGSVFAIWFALASQGSNHLLGKWSVFSFSFRDVDKISDWSWICGKAVSLILVILMAVIMPTLLKKRG